MTEQSEDTGQPSCCHVCTCSQQSESALPRALQALIEDGVQIQDPRNTYIAPEAVIQPEAWIGAGSHILGDSFIGQRARIGPSAIVENSRIGENAVVQAFSHIAENTEIKPDAIVKPRSDVRASIVETAAEIGPNAIVEESHIDTLAKVGPFCRVRAGSAIRAEAYIGTQAEVKHSRIGAGAKIGHFSFVGNANVGPRVNIGAGVVFVNYDGEEIQEATVLEDAFIGSGTMLIAPITVGPRARTSAGAVVTRDIPQDTLVVGAPAKPRKTNP